MYIQKNPNTLLTTAKAKIILLFFSSALIVCSFLIYPYDDSYYYWDWGRHLALSYYDGSPAIAYLMRLFSIIFGNNIVAINFLGVITIFLCLYFIYQTCRLFFNEQIALNACIIWLLSTLVIHFLFLWVTYDNPMMATWTMTMFFSAKFIKNQKTIDLYLIGCSAGLLLLSKYTGVVLLLALMIYITFLPSYRKLFLNKHFYFSLLVSVAIASPVLIWNYQHDWISFAYQLEHRGLPAAWTNVKNYLDKVISQWNILILLPIYALFKNKQNENIAQKNFLLFLNFVSFTFFLFFLYQSITSHIVRHWLTPFTVSGAILCSYYFNKFQLRKTFLLTVVVYASANLAMLTTYSFFQESYDKNRMAYTLAQEAVKHYFQPDTVVVTSEWESAAQILFWLPGKPFIYTLPCGVQNQYAFWNTEFIRNIKAKQIKKILYLDFEDKSFCINKFFTHCEKLPTLTWQNKVKIFADQCIV